VNLVPAETYIVEPNPLLILWTALALVVVVFGLVTALKGRWGWFLIGVFIPGVWIFSAFATPAPTSLWRRAAQRFRATSTGP
jgi:hypothetical protein